jgi:hypothetical protein
MLFDLLDFVLRLSNFVHLVRNISNHHEIDEGLLKEACFIVNIFHHKVGTGLWSISEESEADLKFVLDLLSEKIL